MLSIGPRSPLNFNTATVTSPLSTHLFLLPSSSSTPSPAISKHRQTISSVSSPPAPDISEHRQNISSVSPPSPPSTSKHRQKICSVSSSSSQPSPVTSNNRQKIRSVSSSSSPPSPATSKHRQKIRSVSSLSSVVSTSLYSSFASQFIVVVLSYLLCRAVVHAAPVDTTSNSAVWRHISNSSDQFHNEHLNSTNYTSFQDDMPQNDQPPRSIYPSYTVPDSWKRQSQDRFYYLRADNDQYLQFNGYRVTGTKADKPVLGVVRFLSHDTSMVIVGFHEKKYLCMNASFALYLSDRIDPECYIKESTLIDSGSHATTYDFIKYKTKKKLYLGINCDPMLGSETNQSMKAARFTRLDITKDEAEAARKEVERSGPETHVQAKCERISERKSAARKMRRKLRYRWCWNLDRMIAHRRKYLQQCKDREGYKCDINNTDKDREECVCDILMRMLTKPKRAKRKCLVEKITKWVKHQNSTPNLMAVIEASRLLLPSYSGIARRMLLLKSKQSKHQEEDSNVQPNKNGHQQLMHGHAKNPDNRTSTQTSHQNKIRHQCREGSSEKCRHAAIKLNSILEEFKQELIISGNIPLPVEDPSSTTKPLATNNLSSGTGQDKEMSVLSDKFKKALKLLTRTNSKRHSTKQRRRKTREVWGLQISHLKSKRFSRTNDSEQSRPHFDTVSPG